ncbi:kinetochore Sim4 complex subunit FTA2-domain-containing protein [Chaetomium sp. MPI-CAGE-AT-0009]|nr:kinetochore Sim4 complex subunit FTA2-domain-containing protein [Chaetomium sp. MPI-CAGE-AT-0009]
MASESVFYQARLPSPPVPLPSGVPGPKLAPFTQNAHADIEFIEFLGRENDMDSLVWKVKINNAGPFALKMFYFWHWNFLRRNQGGDLTRELASPQLYIDYFDPFNCECRAYGRLKEEKREDLAVRALGYLLLTTQQEIDLARRVMGRSTPPPSANAATLDGNSFWGRHEQHRGVPVRAIVKDLAANRDPDPAQAAGMWVDLQALHSLGIFVNDTHGGNYLSGKLVDFSRSWTMYHPALDQVDTRTQVRGLMLDELQNLLDYYYDGANASTIIPQDLESFCSGYIEQYRNFPKGYNWLKWEKNADEAKAYVEQGLFESGDH